MFRRHELVGDSVLLIEPEDAADFFGFDAQEDIVRLMRGVLRLRDMAGSDE